MTRMVQCKKLNQELPALERQPYPGEMGERIFNEISKDAWQMWVKQQTILINEYRLSLIDPKSQTYLKEEMMKFLFEGGSTTPDAFVPPTK